MESAFNQLYSYIFDIDVGSGSAATADKPIPSAIFVVNFDKVWLPVLFLLLESCIWYADCPNALSVLVFFLLCFD